MKNVIFKSLMIVLGAVAVGGAPATVLAQNKSSTKQSAPPQGKVTKEWANKTIQSWPETSKNAAKAMLDKYGVPNEATPSQFTWFDNGPWKRTIVYNEEIQHNFPMPHKDVLEQVINMDVPTDKFDELAAYDGSVIVERTKGEISARCDKEGANFLALNLAKDIIDGKKNVEQARQAYGENIKNMMEGRKPAYVQGFQFEVATNDINNPDKSIIDMSDTGTSSATTTE